MIKLALFGDSAVKHYAVADRLWELISIVTNKKIKFDIIPLATADEVRGAFEAFRKDRSFAGFTVSNPWKDVLADQMDELEPTVDLPIINTVYKDRHGTVIGANTAPLAAQLALETKGNLYKCKSALVIGEKNAGLSIAHHLHHNLDKKTYLYDTSAQSSRQKGITRLSSLHAVTKRQYDLIVNTTPLGRYYFDKRIEAFTSPLDLESLSHITHRNTIIQETNFLPGNTLLLQMARHLGLQVVEGDLPLVFRAIESLRRFFGITLDENTVRLLVEEIKAYIAEKETDILERSNA